MERNRTIAIVDDDPNIAELIRLYLDREGFSVRVYASGQAFLQEIRSVIPDLLVLDIMLPGMDGYEVLKEVRRISQLPVMMLTARGETFDKVLGLELGADDYLVKPFDGKELVARIKALLRRVPGAMADPAAVLHPNLAIDPTDFTVTYHGERIDMPPKELELLYYLARHPNRVFTRDQLLEQIWGYDFSGDSRTVDVHIKRIREKLLQEEPWEIKTVWSVGYKFQTK